MYLEGRSSGNFPVDDEDGEDDGSGSGSGDFGKETMSVFIDLFLSMGGTPKSQSGPV